MPNKTESYQVVVIGSGPGGYVAANKAAQAGLRTAVIEKDQLGGVCLNWGCIPTKSLLRDAQFYEHLQSADKHGFTIGQVKVDTAKVVARSRKVADKMQKGVGMLLKKYQVTHIEGSASFLSANQLEVQNGKEKHLVEAEHIIVATGAHPRPIASFAVDHKQVWDYRDAIVCNALPKSLLVVGAGAIGVEFAYYFNAFGVKVHLVEKLPQLLPNEDEEIAQLLQRSFKGKGIRCDVGASLTEFKASKKGVSATLTKADGSQEAIQCEKALIAVGMQGSLSGLNIEAAGLKPTPQGFIEVDSQLRTPVKGVYAIGDVAGRQLLAHKASAEAETVIAAIAGHQVSVLDYEQMPACTYCQPQVASLGIKEAECKTQNIDIEVGKFPYLANGKANALGETEGMVKLIFGKPHKQLLGVHMIGSEVTELLAELSLAMKLEATADEILATVHAHPTLSEAVFEATGVAYGVSANF